MLRSKLFLFSLSLSIFLSSVCLNAEEREWKDKSGHYVLKAELIAYNYKTIVLQKADKQLVSMEINDLSDADKKYMNAIRTGEKKFAPPESRKTWTMKSGLKVKGQVVAFTRRNVKFAIEGEDTYINDKLFKNLPPIYQQMAPKIVSHFEKLKLNDEAGLRKFLLSLPEGSKEYVCEGVLFELQNGDRYGVPLFLFSELDQSALRPALKRWSAENQSREQQEQESLYLRAQTQTSNEELTKMRQIAEIKLQLQAYDAGLFDLWEVELIVPGNGRYSVIVPGRSSDDAARMALTKYPGNRVGAIAKKRRRR